MSKLEELIKEFCPNGVGYVKIRRICKSLPKGTLKTSELVEGGMYPVINAGKDLYGYYSQCNNNGDAFTLSSRGEYAGSVNYFENKFWAGGLCYPYTSSNPEICLTKFIYYYLKNIEKYIRCTMVAEGSIPALNKKDLQELQIPLPALPVQREIVRILDSFTLYSAELTAELTARRKQYEFYRDKLLTFDDTISANVKKIELGNIADIAVGTKPEQVFEEKNLYEYINAGTTNSGYVDSYNCLGDTVTTPSRGQGGIGFVGYQRQNFWLGPLCYKIKSNTDEVLTKYIFHYLQNNTNLILSLKKEGGVPAVNRSDLVKIPLIYPPRAVQERIVKVLDNFDAICSDLGIGLPAEIEKRQKQYEYYRDKLLTF